jgi:hypothetical protein
MKVIKILAATAIALTLTVGLASNGNECTAVGTFDGSFTRSNGNKYYHFKSNDNEVWWSLTENQMGFVPKANTEYTLTYDNMGTTKANKPCDCAPKFECECEVYDDEFISIKEVQQGK